MSAARKKSSGGSQNDQMAAAAFIDESIRDRDFYFLNALKIEPKEGGRIIPLDMRPAQRALMDLIDRIRAQGRAPRIVILKARRLGFSTVMCAETFRTVHLSSHKQCLMVAHKTDLTDTLFKNLHLMWEQLPKGVQPKKKYSSRRLIQLEDNDSRVAVEVAGESRGYTAQVVHISELAFIEESVAKKLINAIMHVVPDDPDSLICIESTPNGIGNTFHDIWTQAQSGRSEWVPFFVPWFHDPTYRRTPWFSQSELDERLDDAGKRAQEVQRANDLDLDQMAWWLWTLANKCLNDLDVMDQEYASDPYSCFLASGSRVFDRDGLTHYFALSGYNPERHETADERMAREQSDGRWHEIEEVPGDPKHPRVYPQRGGKLWVAQGPETRHKYIVGADISAGDPNSDPCPLCILDQHTLRLVAVWDGKTPPEVLARIAHRLALHYNGARIIGEANNHGILFHHVLFTELHYPNLQWRKTSESSTSGRVTDKLGFWTSGENREHLFNLVRRFVREKAGIVEYERMVLEWSELQRDDSGRVDHPDGGTSDLTLAFALCLVAHAGGFDSQLQPLEMEQRTAVAAVSTAIRRARAFGHDTKALEGELDLLGMTIEDADKVTDLIEDRSRKRARLGLSGET